MLTDDYFFYYGLKQLTGLPLFHITYEGVVNKSIAIKHKRNIRVLVDSRIFLFREMGRVQNVKGIIKYDKPMDVA